MLDLVQLRGHQHKTNKTVRDALKIVGKEIGVAYSDTVKLFIGGDARVTIAFWDLIYKTPGNKGKYNCVDFCHVCKKFNLKHQVEKQTTFKVLYFFNEVWL